MSPQKQNEPKFSAQPDAVFKTDVVENIPLHQAAPLAAAPISEAEDIDGIMKDVAKEVKKVDEAPKKHHMFGHKEHPKPAGHHTAPVTAAPPPPAATAGPMPRQPAPAPKPRPAEARSSVPVMVIIFTLIITAFLIVAAISTYKK